MPNGPSADSGKPLASAVTMTCADPTNCCGEDVAILIVICHCVDEVRIR